MQRDIATLAERQFDLVVIGGGILGAACLWDATQRGLKAALVEAVDFASGTSWNSLKTIHGGLRYLQSLDLARMRQSIGDRRALLRIAPDLVRPLPFVVPTFGHGRRGRVALTLGLALTDLVAHDRNRGLDPAHVLPRGRRLSRQQVLELMPGLDARGLTGGARWYDAQVASSERLVLAFLLQAAEEGAVVANYVEVTSLLRDGARVTGVVARDLEGGRNLEIRASVVLAATGPWTPNVLALAGLDRPRVPLLRAVNVVTRRPQLAGHALGGLADGRYLFMAPWGQRTLIGTAYQPEQEGSLGGTIETLLRDTQAAFPWAALTLNDVCLVHSGLVPGERDASGLWSRDLLTDHARHGAPGLVSVVGVKYTTARAVAESAVDLAFRRLGREAPRCRTAETPLRHARVLGGTLSERARHCATDEMALHLSDAVLRRLDLGTGGPPPAEELETVATTIADAFDWTDERLRSERAALAERLRLGLPSEAATAR